MSTWIVALIAAAVLAIIAVVLVATRREGSRPARVAVYPRGLAVPGLDDTSAVPVVITCHWCPITPEDGSDDEATRDDCTCPEPCGEPWCGRLRYMTNWNGS